MLVCCKFSASEEGNKQLTVYPIQNRNDMIDHWRENRVLSGHHILQNLHNRNHPKLTRYNSSRVQNWFLLNCEKVW
jgi:hypothetical protein